MPIYEYQCKKCDSHIEVMQSISAKPLKTCTIDGCNGKVERLVSASGFILKGSGWYASDYPSESRKKGWEQESKAASGKADGDAHTCGSGCSHGGTPGSESTAKPAPAAESAPKPKPKQKNPYSGAKRKSSKAASSS